MRSLTSDVLNKKMKLVADDDSEAVEECCSQESEKDGCEKIQETSTEKSTEKSAKTFPTINISNCTVNFNY
jgi:hypothetical protein